MFGLSDIVINDLKSVFRQYSNIEEVRIFGSRAKGNYSEGSDIDLALIGEGLTFNTIMDINIKIEDLELLYKVDILNYMEKRGTPIGNHIDRVGQLFYKKDIVDK